MTKISLNLIAFCYFYHLLPSKEKVSFDLKKQATCLYFLFRKDKKQINKNCCVGMETSVHSLDSRTSVFNTTKLLLKNEF